MKKLTKFLTVFLLALLGANLQPAWAYSATFYCVPEYLWGDSWDDNDDQWVRANFMCKQNNQEKWHSPSMTKTGKKYHGYDIYSVTDGTLEENGVQKLQFQRMKANSTTVNATYDVMSSWWGQDGFNNKMYKADWNNGSPVWYDYSYDPVFNYAHLYYKIDNGTEQNYKFDGNKDEFNLGTITSAFTITNMYLNYSKNNGNICNGHMGYKIDNGSNQSLKPDSWTWKEGGGEMQWKNANYELINAEQNSGKHTLTIWWAINGGWAGNTTACDDNTWYYSNSGNNYTWKYTILPPAVSNFGVTPSGAVAGTGTLQDPFIMPYNGTLTLTVNNLSQAHADANSSLSLTGSKKGSSTTSIEPTNNVFTVSSIKNTTSIYSVTISAKYHNSSVSLDGAESTATYYYKVGQYTLTLDANGGQGGTTSTTVNLGGQSFTATAPTRTGYSCQGYYDDAAMTTKIASSAATPALQTNTQYTDADGKWKVTNGATLYAGWKAKSTTITLDKQEGSGGKSSVTATYDDAMPDAGAVPDKTGYDFGGYFDGQDGTGTKYYNADCSSAHIWDKDVANATLYAYWTPKSYTITLRQTSATTQGATSTTVYYNTVPTQITSLPTRTGYTFGGYETSGDVLLINATGVWQANVDGFTDADGKWIKTTTATLDPIWNPITTTITIDMNSGDNENQQISAVFDAALNISGINQAQVTKTGYSFNGLYTAASNGSYIVNKDWVVRTTLLTDWLAASSIWKNPNTTATLYVQWTPNNYTITLNNNGADSGKEGTASITATYDANTNLTTAITIPEKQYNTFGGYYIGETQIIDAGGNFVPSVEGYTDAYKNWKYAGDVELLAKWTASKQCTVTFGITDGTATAAYGTLSATVNDVAFTSGSQVPSGTTIVFTWANANGSYSSGTAYTFGKWYDNVVIEGANELILTKAGASDYVWSYTITDDISIYQAPTVNTYTITSHTANPVAGGEVTADSWNVGPVVPCEVTATANPGYTFSSWTLGGALKHSEAQGTLTKSPITLYSANSGERTVTANFTANTNTAYIVKHYKQNLDGTYPTEPTETDNLTGTTDTEVTPSTKEYEGFTAPSTKTVTIAGDGTTIVEYRYTRKSYNISYTTQATGWTYGTKPATAKFEENVSFVVNPATGSSVAVTSSDATLNESAAPTYTFEMPAKDVQINVAATEILLPLTTSANESYMGTVEKTKTEIGVATTSTLTASSANRNYKFKQWNLTNCTITSGTINDATITVKGDGVNNPSAEAEFEVAWLISGNTDISTGWDVYGVKMTVVSDGVFKYEFNATKVASNDGDYNFKVYNTTRTAYYANKEGGSGWWFTRGADSTTLAEGAQSSTNMSLRSDMVGNYIFTLDCSTSRANPTLTVTFPTSTTYNVDIYYDGVTKTTVEGGAFAKQITAQVPESMQFDHWEVEGETSNVHITSTTSQTTTFTASGTGAIIRAKFNTNKRIYLKGGSNFSDAYMNFYKSDYWDNDLGTGNNSDLCVGKNWKMFKVTNTDIFWLDISGAPGEWKDYFSFVNKSGDYNNFSMCNVVYRNDMKDALPFYVPRNSYASEHHNTSQYFNEGIWMKYNSTESGYDIRGFDNWEDKTHRFVAATPGGYEFKTTLHLTAGTTYEFKIYNDNGTSYGATGQTMTATSCTNWKMHLNNDNCKITASEAGDYTFVLNLGSGEVIVSVEYPLSNNDYHVVAKEGETVKWVGDLIKNSKNVAKKDTTSFFNNNYTYQLQQYAGENNWNNIGGEVTITDDKAKVGVINLIVTQDESGNATLTYEGVYKGNYYIRTDGVDGGWGSYKTNPDNKMDNYGSLLVADPTYQYDVYKAKWVLSGKNVKFRIANDYSKAISDELKEDVIIGNKETLPQGANVRFMWNSKTNQLKRAYISGSTDTKDRYLVLEGDAKMFDKDGKALTEEGGGKVVGLDDYELNFEDKNNWVYQADIKAQSGCAVKLTAKYNNQVQYFIGAAGEGTGSRKTIIAGSGTDKYTMRVVYDFKTNLLIAGWVPDGKEITDTIKLGGDMLITRTHQDSAQQIIFGTTGSIEDIHHIYGVLSIKKDTMLGNGIGDAKYKTVATNADYERTMYWISFPFKVKISEIFGVDGYGTKWIMQKYRGDLRAQKGWFKEDTPTFWEYMDVTDSLNAYEGYLFLIDANYFNTEDADVWKNSATEANFYFPSASGNIGIINKSEYTQEVPAHKCEIKREFNIGTEQYPIMVSHEQTDSYWNVIGVPAFQNKSLVLGTETTTEMKAIYEWNSTDNTYTPRALQDQFRFQTMHAYMVQFGGDITWSDVSVVNNPTTAPYRYADTKNYFIKLFFGNNEAEDHAYINLADEASTDFVLNEDMMKLDNAGYPNIYSFAGNYNVAYNETKMTNQSVTIGVSAPKDGSYTFSMPKDFSGSAILVDLEEGTYTDLNVSNYSVDLNKGTYNNRFQLMLEVEAKTPTAIDNAKGEWNADGKTKKLLINDQIYLINGGRVYNATGVQLR